MYDEDTKNIIIEGNDGYKKAQTLYENDDAFSCKKDKKIQRQKSLYFLKKDIEEKLNQIYDSEDKTKIRWLLSYKPN